MVASVAPLKVTTLLRVKPAPVTDSVTPGPARRRRGGATAKSTGDYGEGCGGGCGDSGCVTSKGKGAGERAQFGWNGALELGGAAISGVERDAAEVDQR